MKSPPVKDLAVERGIPVYQPRRIRDGSLVETIRSLSPDILAVVAYGRILPPEVLASARRGAVNLHSSLLPKYRGASPVAWAIAGGESVTGVTTMRMVEELDAGDIYLQRSTSIAPTETAGELEARLAVLGASLLVETLDAIEKDEMAAIPQREEEVSYAPILKKEDGRIDWSLEAEAIACRVRAFDPWPGAFTRAGDRTLRIWRALPAGGHGALTTGDAAASSQADPGTILEAGKDHVVVACGGSRALELLEVQPEGRKRILATQAAAGRYFQAGDRFN
jgi:methionyl-tRNA formyltransferase